MESSKLVVHKSEKPRSRAERGFSNQIINGELNG
jgi:hypothetical protein